MPPIRHPVPLQVAPERHAQWHRAVAEQSGTLDTDQLRSFGVDREAISAQVAAGRWRLVTPRVYAVFTGPLPRATRIAAALRYAGPSAILSHDTAAELWGMHRESDGPIHVTVPYQCSAVSQQPMITVHRSRAFPYLAVDGNPPLTTRADTALDLGSAQPTAREAQVVITELVTAHHVGSAQVRYRLFERPPRRYRRAIEQALDRLDAGVESVLEEAYAVDVEAAHGLPEARRQEPVRVDGQILFEDAVYDNTGVALTVRLDGRSHLEAKTAYRDRRRDNAAELAGRSRLTFGWQEVHTTPCRSALEVAEALRLRGWAGPFQPCPRCPSTPSSCG